VLDVCELHLQAVGASAVVAEVGLAGAFGGDVAQLLLAGADTSWASNSRAAYCGGRAMVRWRSRASSVVPGAAVKPNRARVSMTRPVVVATCFLGAVTLPVGVG
jgi:hypothetical protein